MSAGPGHTVLHYVGYDDDRGGIVSVVRTLAQEGRFACVLGVNPGFRQERTPPLSTLVLPRVEGEHITAGNMARACHVARAARAWLGAGPDRVFHGRSRAGLLAALWLRAGGETRMVASVHCLGRQRWFYRAAAAMLGPRLVWLGPAMKRHYRVGEATWSNCVPDCVALGDRAVARQRGGPMRLGCVGGLVAVKQWDLVLRALAQFPPGVSASVVHAGGEDGTRESATCARKLRQLAHELGVADRIEWRGPVRDLTTFYAEIDALVVASRWEASSVAALEAAARGVPVIAPDTAGTRDLVETAHAGWLFRADDPPALARLLATLTTENTLGKFQLNPMGLRPFSAPVVAQQWAEIYARLSGTR